MVYAWSICYSCRYHMASCCLVGLRDMGLTPYQQQMTWARKIEADHRYERGVAAILHAIYLRREDGPYTVLYHIRGLCGDDCRWCK